MKKIYFAICCALMVGTSFAQDATTPPVAIHPGDVSAAVVEAPAVGIQVQTTVESTALPQEVVVAQEAPVATESVVLESAPVESAVITEAAPAEAYAPQSVEVQAYDSQAYAAPVATGCSGCATNSVVAAQSVVAAPQYQVAPQSVVAAPVANSYVGNVATCDTCNNGISRRHVVRGVATRVSTQGRTLVSRVRGRRNNCCN